MKSLRRKILAVAAVVAISGLTMASVAGATDRLLVKDGSGTVKFNVQDTGNVGIGLGTTTPAAKLHIADTFTTNLSSSNIEQVFNNNVQRYVLRADGVSLWNLTNGTAEIGQIAYATPSNAPGIVQFTYNTSTGTYTDNRTEWVNFPATNAAYLTAYNMITYHANYYNPSISFTPSNNVGIGLATPTQKLEVNGGLRINPAAITPNGRPTIAAPTKPTCDNTTAANDRGTFWFTKNASTGKDILEICAQDGTGNTAWRTLY